MALGFNCNALAMRSPNAGQWACKVLQVADVQRLVLK